MSEEKTYIYKRDGLYLHVSERHTHTGFHQDVTWVEDINHASLYRYLSPELIKKVVGAEKIAARRIVVLDYAPTTPKTERLKQLIPLTSDQIKDHCAVLDGLTARRTQALNVRLKLEHWLHWEYPKQRAAVEKRASDNYSKASRRSHAKRRAKKSAETIR